MSKNLFDSPPHPDTREAIRKARGAADQILKELVEPSKVRMQEMIDRLIEKNDQLAGGQRHDSFRHKNILFSHSRGMLLPSDRDVLNLHPSLWEEFEAYWKLRQKTRHDEMLMRHVLTDLVCSRINSPGFYQGIRDALPDCLQSFHPELSKYPRRQQVAWSIQFNSKAMKRFYQALPLFEAYSVLRYIY